jgi:hypothetical protein
MPFVDELASHSRSRLDAIVASGRGIAGSVETKNLLQVALVKRSL